MKQLLTLLLSIGLTTNLFAQHSLKKDSVAIHHIVIHFYDYYLTSIKNHKTSAYNPIFIKDHQGNTTLSFSEYFSNLKKYSFSDSLIYSEKQSYQSCILNLQKIPYSDFEKKYTDLDQFREMNCDFSNYYRWIGGQDPIEEISISKIQFTYSTNALVIVQKNYYDAEEKKTISLGTITVNVIKVNNTWKINKIDVL